jgi:3-oxoacyl-[acyl-carrier protein] reductase
VKLEAKRAVVTGASRGIGRAIAQAYAREGAAVIVNYCRSGDAAQSCVYAIRDAGGWASALQADLADPSEISRLVDGAVAELGAIDIWANIAGSDILTGNSASDSDLDKLTSLIDVDLRGTMLCSWAAASAMLKDGGGVILNMSWDLALRGMAGRNPEMFAAVKGGVTGFTRSLARSLAPAIRVNEVCPGWIETEFAETLMSSDYRNGVVERTPLGRLGVPEDVAEAAVFLASDDAAFITGQSLKINGGLSS